MNRYTVQESLICSPCLVKWEGIKSFNVLEDAIKYVGKLCLNKNCELTYFRIYDNIDDKIVVDWSKKDIIYDVCNSISLIDEGIDDNIFSKMLRACENIYNIIDILESNYNELTNIDVYTKYDIRTSIHRLYSDTINLKSLLEDCKEITYVD
jgi:hypothetical protein